jgi:hypothetical protein
MDNMAMNDNGVVGELRAIDGEKRTQYESPYARGVGVAKIGIPTQLQIFQVEQDSNFGRENARNIVVPYKSKPRKSSFHVR